MKVKYKRLGRTGLKISEIGLGCLPFGGHVDEQSSITMLNKALEEGINLFDTADRYQDGRSEEILGKALKTWQRDNVVVCTKVRGKTGENPNDIGLSRKHIMASVEASLRRLQTDYIDLYYAHWPDNDTPIDETLRAFDDLVHAGKVRYLGCSNFAAWELCRALWTSSESRLARFDCVQPHYNLLTRMIEYDLIPLCAAEGVGIITYNALGGGFLTGKYKFGSPPGENTRFGRQDFGKLFQERYWYQRNFEAIDKLTQISKKYNRTLPQLALAWVMNNPAVSSVLVSATSMSQLEQNLTCLGISLLPEEVIECNKVWDDFLPEGWGLQTGMRQFRK